MAALESHRSEHGGLVDTVTLLQGQLGAPAVTALAGYFVTDAWRRLGDISDAIVYEPGTVAERARALSHECSFMSAVGLVALARQLERRALRGTSRELRSLVREMRRELGGVEAALAATAQSAVAA